MAMVAWEHWRKDKAGWLVSLLLHGVFLVLCLSWTFHAAVPPQRKAVPVDLVPMLTIGPGRPGGAPLVRPQPRQALAPVRAGERPQANKPPPDEIEARIAALASLREAAAPLPAPDNDGAAAGTGDGAGYALADFVRAQILRKWWPKLETQSARATAVAIRLKISRTGVLSDIRIVDQQRFAADRQFRDMALSARNAAILASPIPLPPGNYEAMKDIAITLDLRAVLR
jgi:hypothetical protein